MIGVPLPVERILKAAPGLAKTLAFSPRAFDGLTRAIMTTNTRPKRAAATCRIAGKTVHVAGCAKGAGMIHPALATMIVGKMRTDLPRQRRDVVTDRRPEIGR